MRPMRSFGGRGGGGLPGLETMAAKLTVALVAGSLLYLATAKGQGGLLLLWPGSVFGQLFLWQPISYVFVESQPFSILFAGLLLWSVGGWLEGAWGPKRLLLVALGVPALAGYILGVAGLFLPLPGGYQGGWVMGSVLWVAYGLTIGQGQTNFWGIPLSGNAFAAIGGLFVLMRVLSGGLISQLPDVLSLLLVVLYLKGGSPRRLLLHFQHWRLQRQLRERSKHLHVVPKDRPDRDQFLN
ncbi:rhomboid family intramembrane serine protease [Myxococcus sp. K15C18031901]|uniref:rhomboid family intramembrane serine protease n=1 Tax=Myxococcus dinghuensis TaxID=2906761 RepID=UPI0020A799C3|nr:rhomboid family intramembrane serine protease [Myxococcus dinghuensis]MCP3101162.1 rhomboid family intramembrane serine protease [Myxococcus dinghuensis]